MAFYKQLINDSFWKQLSNSKINYTQTRFRHVSNKVWTKAHRGTFNPRKVETRQTTFEKKLILATTEPVMGRDKRPSWEKCYMVDRVPRPDHPYDVLLAKDFIQLWNQSRMIVFFHKNPALELEDRLVKNMFEHQKIYLHSFDCAIVDIALRDTPYHNALHLYQKKNSCIGFAPESNVSNLLKLTRKANQLIFLGGIIDNKFLNVAEFTQFSKLPSLDIIRAQFCATLQSAVSNLSRTLSFPTQSLSYNLQEYNKMLDADKKNNSET